MSYSVGYELPLSLSIRRRHCLSPTSYTAEGEALSSYQHPWGGMRLYIPTHCSFFTAPLLTVGGKPGKDSLFVSFSKTVTGFPDSIILCLPCHACITGSHLFLNCTTAEEFIKWTTATWFLSRPCWWWHHWVSERQQSVDTACDKFQTNICHKRKKFWGSAILSCFHMDEHFFGLHSWQRTKSFCSEASCSDHCDSNTRQNSNTGFLPTLC